MSPDVLVWSEGIHRENIKLLQKSSAGISQPVLLDITKPKQNHDGDANDVNDDKFEDDKADDDDELQTTSYIQCLGFITICIGYQQNYIKLWW